MKKVLIIVDPQNDFISGSLAIDGASEKMKSLSSYLKQNRQKYESILVTMDSHPANHCSFKENGGIWDTHCVKNTDGWFIEPDLAKTLTEFKHVEIFNKGTNSDKEEYSIINNEDDGVVFLERLYDYSSVEKLDIDICGIAGDYCVLETLKNLYFRFKHITVLSDYIASCDGGEKLKDYISKHKDINLIGELSDDEIKMEIPNGYEFFEVKTKEVVFRKKSLPHTLEECCNILGVDYDNATLFEYENGYEFYAQSAIVSLQHLLICRDAYWKIHNDWKPDWYNNLQYKYYISTKSFDINFNFNTSSNKILCFPTEEMRDKFYHNFKHLIEKCKMLI